MQLTWTPLVVADSLAFGGWILWRGGELSSCTGVGRFGWRVMTERDDGQAWRKQERIMAGQLRVMTERERRAGLA